MEIFKNTYNKVYPLVTTDIGIDLGTANTLVYIRGKGIVLNEPSVVAINRKTNQVVAVGADAKRMLGRTPQHIDAVRPLVEGVISDFEIAQEMMAYLVSKAREMVSGKFIAPRIVIGVPSGITNVERRAVHDATKAAGARSVFLVEEPVAAAVGIQLPIHDPVGNMILDIGGGTADIAILSLGGLVTSRNVKVGGDHFDADIAAYVRSEFRVLIGEKTAEHLKITAGRVIEGEEPIEVTVKGRDVVTGLPREVVVTDSDVRAAITPALESLVNATRSVLEETPPELVSDILENGIFLVGGGALIGSLDEYLEAKLNIPIYIGSDPMTAVARGAGTILEHHERYADLLLRGSEVVT